MRRSLRRTFFRPELSNILLKSDNQDMDLGPSLHLNTGTIVDICNFEGNLPRLIDILGNEYFGTETLIKFKNVNKNVNSSSSVSGLSMVFYLL